MDHAIRLLPSHFFSPLHVLLASDSLSTLDDDEFLKRNAVIQLQPTAPVLLLVFALLSHEVIQPPRIERPALESPGVTELGDKGNASRSLKKCPDVTHSLEDQQTLVYSAEASRLGSVHSSSKKKRKISSLMKETARQSKKVT